MGSSPQKKFSTDKLFYKIGEVSNIAEVEPHVLRYWESEFSFLKPRKNKTGQRVYSRKDVEQVLKIRDLLYKEKYTISGVRNKFASKSQSGRTVSIQTIQGVKKKLKEILHSLSKSPDGKRPRSAAKKAPAKKTATAKKKTRGKNEENGGARLFL
jgi:DNA-binding transcriptional MerR regulator